ncbi:hypothetical protein QT971_19645 [Microcoleus sp. herbarium19]|uniref:hypothetical protein n=1 Tax=Microcoleus sp. herbarium13 TaxID=3055438 RepID=UPI002FD53924
MADTANTCEVFLTSSLSEGFRQDKFKKGSICLKYYFEHNPPGVENCTNVSNRLSGLFHKINRLSGLFHKIKFDCGVGF